jgi:hypothetical protein
MQTGTETQKNLNHFNLAEFHTWRGNESQKVWDLGSVCGQLYLYKESNHPAPFSLVKRFACVSTPIVLIISPKENLWPTSSICNSFRRWIKDVLQERHQNFAKNSSNFNFCLNEVQFISHPVLALYSLAKIFTKCE